MYSNYNAYNVYRNEENSINHWRKVQFHLFEVHSICSAYARLQCSHIFFMKIIKNNIILTTIIFISYFKLITLWFCRIKPFWYIYICVCVYIYISFPIQQHIIRSMPFLFGYWWFGILIPRAKHKFVTPDQSTRQQPHFGFQVAALWLLSHVTT